jgi:2,5-diketo-D-gluconate reductase A
MHIPSLPLNDGTSLPQIGLGTWKTPDADAPRIVADAISAGYRLVDTASEYKNDVGVGAGLRSATVSPAELILATKVWNSDQGFDRTLRAAESSLERLGRSRIDLYLIHWPAPAKDLYVETWKALIELQRRGQVRSIGVCNFQRAHLERIIGETGVTPVVNQIELSPELAQKELRDFHAQHQIVTESWSPLARGNLVQKPEIIAMAQNYSKTPAQIILRWHVQSGLVVIPKSVRPERLRENLAIFDFVLSLSDMAALDGLDAGKRLGPNPDTFNQ